LQHGACPNAKVTSAGLGCRSPHRSHRMGISRKASRLAYEGIDAGTKDDAYA